MYFSSHCKYSDMYIIMVFLLQSHIRAVCVYPSVPPSLSLPPFVSEVLGAVLWVFVERIVNIFLFKATQFYYFVDHSGHAV